MCDTQTSLNLDREYIRFAEKENARVLTTHCSAFIDERLISEHKSVVE